MVWLPQRIPFVNQGDKLGYWSPDGGPAMPGQKMLESILFRTRFRDDSGWVAGLHFGGGICEECTQLLPSERNGSETS